jgi:hypothetical protein
MTVSNNIENRYDLSQISKAQARTNRGLFQKALLFRGNIDVVKEEDGQ